MKKKILVTGLKCSLIELGRALPVYQARVFTQKYKSFLKSDPETFLKLLLKRYERAQFHSGM